jgi:hypothetical protein
VPYEQVERLDEDLPKGVRVLAQRGVPGFKVRRYRIVREGPHAIRERYNDVYPPTTQIIRVGTSPTREHAARPEDDPHPEYLADELLVMTQGLDSEKDKGEQTSTTTREWRESGKYGERGWTERAGMPLWHGSDDEET